MKTSRALLVGSLIALCLAGGALASAQDEATCHHDQLALPSGPISIALCPSADPDGKNLALRLTLSRDGSTLTHNVQIGAVSGADVMHLVRDIPLADFGLSNTLHATVRVDRNGGTIEHALLLPGAIVLK
jgi:hypothetical protein